MESSLARELSEAGTKVQYDERVKNVLAEKIVLAWILKFSAKEFYQMDYSEIVECIEGEPEVSLVRVNPGETNEVRQKPNRTTGMKNEDKVVGEGVIYFDIRFYAWVPELKERIKLIINIEAQKSFYPGYEIVTRGVFYSGRMLSAQLHTEFEIPDYDSLKKVYSIWICMNAPEYIGNAISRYTLVKEDIVSGIPDKQHAYDKIAVVVICLNEKMEKETEFLRMLNTLLSPEKSIEEKKWELEETFHIEMEKKLEKELRIMCNLSEWVEEIGMEKGMEKGAYNKLKEIVGNMLLKGFGDNAIAEILGESGEVIQKIVLEMEQESAINNI